jgi:hypothetical protein
MRFRKGPPPRPPLRRRQQVAELFATGGGGDTTITSTSLRGALCSAEQPAMKSSTGIRRIANVEGYPITAMSRSISSPGGEARANTAHVP